MATPADQRLLELLGKWLKSLELHAKYSSLDDDSYWKIQPWVEHQRPSRWIIDLAKQKTIALKAQAEERIKQGDAQYSESLELMIFLANLVGAEHIERFIPMAEPGNERALTPLEAQAGTDAAITGTPDDAAITGTREMPKMPLGARPGAPPPDSNSQVARVERKTSTGKSSARTAAEASQGDAEPAAAAVADAAEGPQSQVVADAVRLVQWGRKWFELPELIARMAGRPPLSEVRRLLKENKKAIEAKSGKD
jgi:hypothetical protein